MDKSRLDIQPSRISGLQHCEVWYRVPCANQPALDEVKPRAAIYARCASWSSGDDSIARQVTNCTKYAEQHGALVVAVYKERGFGGITRDMRAALSRLLADAKNGYFDRLIIEDISRLSRDEGDLHRIINELAQSGVTLHDGEGELVKQQIFPLGYWPARRAHCARSRAMSGKRGR